ncbi:excinuclease ABC subunit UvrC [Clostridia bacterium]|nr:excinuclease ABC subunit UvrC [Clostridia bacterium]
MGKNIEKKLHRLPKSPGVYLMRGESNQVIYVGKAKNLKNRVRSYFRDKVDRPKTAIMVSQIRDLEWIVTESETEALVLECNLIKEYRPKYNIRLVDDKHYPYIKVTIGEDFPRVLVVRRRGTDGSRYFGPYTSAGAMHEVLSLIRELFSLRSCGNQKFKNRKRPCLNYQIKRCDAPCMGKISKEEYAKQVKEAILLLEGNTNELIRLLNREMQAAAEGLAFEKAARIRDQIKALKNIGEKQKVIMEKKEDQDVIAIHAGENRAVVQLFFVRNGKVINRETFEMDNTGEQEEAAVMAAFLKQYYLVGKEIPARIVVDVLPEEQESLEQWLKERRGKKVELFWPQRGEAKRLVHMVKENAKLTYLDNMLQKKKKELSEAALSDLGKALSLPSPPHRIECYDISNIQGSNTVASMVVFLDGKAANSEYRRFTIRTVEGPNDFASMQEVLSRRFRGAKEEKPGFEKIPDLIIIDGGKGQLSSARAILKEYGFSSIPTFGLAKREELLFREGESEPIRLERDSEALYLVQRVRDEAHRFAITFHREKRDKRTVTSILDSVPGIGPKRKKQLLNTFGSAKGVRRASAQEIADTLHISLKKAEEVKEYLG